MQMNTRTVSRAGVSDWLLQRISAVCLIAYLLILCFLLIKHSPLNFTEWQSIFSPLWFKIISLIAFLSISVHSWVGVWTIFTDYIHPWKLRLILMSVVMLLLIAYFIWFVQIMWGV
jgi:succinate dehydrogenase / fumarate reductase membrane anchor subunit